MQAPIVRIQRVFLALWPDDGVREQLAAHTGRWAWPLGCVPYLPTDWHLTLHFIGNVDADRVAKISAGAGVPCQAFELILEQPELWPNGLAVLAATEAPAPLRALHDGLGRALRDSGLPVATRPRRPHVTLARHADGAIPPAASRPVVWRVQGFALALSSGDRNQRYQVIHQYPCLV